MPFAQSAVAKIYKTNRPDAPWLVVFRNPTRCEKNGRAQRVQKWFVDKVEAHNYRDQLEERLMVEGAAGVTFDAVLRTDAIAARSQLNQLGHHLLTLSELARSYIGRMATAAPPAEPIAVALKAFLEDKEKAEGRTGETIKNLSTRLGMWIDLAKIGTVSDIDARSVDILRRRSVRPQTKCNDLGAVSSFCSWLLDQGKIGRNPLKGLRRPRAERRRPEVFSPEECARLLSAAENYCDGKWLGTVAVMLFVGARPSEIEDTRLFYDGRPVARIEGGKLRGRANRVVPLLPVAVAWLRRAASPDRVPTLTRAAREKLTHLASINWKHDVCRHTFISYRLEMVKNDAAVAREAGTSEEIVFRHYHRLPIAGGLRRWLALRPTKDATD